MSWARAFIALATYILEQNGEYPSDLPSHSTALSDLKSALLDTDSWRIDDDLNDDAVKWTSVMTSMARAMDLYLALENAYDYYGVSSSALLSSGQKQSVFVAYGLNQHDLEYLGGEGRGSFMQE